MLSLSLSLTLITAYLCIKKANKINTAQQRVQHMHVCDARIKNKINKHENSLPFCSSFASFVFCVHLNSSAQMCLNSKRI